jgi:hypothetical protein
MKVTLLLDHDEARRIAANIARLRESLNKQSEMLNRQRGRPKFDDLSGDGDSHRLSSRQYIKSYREFRLCKDQPRRDAAESFDLLRGNHLFKDGGPGISPSQ